MFFDIFFTDSRFGARTRRREAPTLRNREDSSQERTQHQGGDDPGWRGCEKYYVVARIVGQSVPESESLQETIARARGHVPTECDQGSPIPKRTGSCWRPSWHGWEQFDSDPCKTPQFRHHLQRARFSGVPRPGDEVWPVKTPQPTLHPSPLRTSPCRL